MYGKSVNRQASVALVLVAALSGLLAAAVSGENVGAGGSQEAVQHEALPMLPEIVITATRLDA